MQVELTPAEWRAVELWRKMGFGDLTLHIDHGKPVGADVALTQRFDKPEWQGADEVLQDLRTSVDVV